MDILFKSISERLSTEVPELRWIDWEQGQIDTNMESSYPVQFPAVLIDFPSISWQSIKQGIQDGEVTLQVRVIFDVYEDFNTESPNRDLALGRLKLINKIHKALHNFSGNILQNNGIYEDTHFNSLERTSTSSEQRDDGLKVINMFYITLLRDKSGMKDYATTTINKVIISSV